MSKNSNADAATDEKYNPCKGKPYNRYNIYYILEREKILQSNPKYCSKTAAAAAADACPADFITGYENLQMPSLPPRYAHLNLSYDWYMPGKRKATKRDHKKSHGLISFQEMARLAADGWRSIDDETLEYVSIVADELKNRHKELMKKYPEFARSNSGGSSKSNKQNGKATKTKQPRESRKSLPKVNMSDLVVSSSSPDVVGCSNSSNSNDAQRKIPSRAKMNEVDIADQDIMAMWYFD
ncbi:hypothetical protein ACHAXR_002834 [Thalassiosira sp. AJA248-18]